MLVVTHLDDVEQWRPPLFYDRVNDGRPLTPGRAYLHPLPLLATVVLVANDYFLKGHWISPVTGKLSDITGLFILPLVLIGVFEVVLFSLGRSWAVGTRGLAISVAAVGIVFSAVKVSPSIASSYGDWVSALWHPFYVVGSHIPVLRATGSPNIRIVSDWSDLMALPMLLLTWYHGRRLTRNTSPRAEWS